MKFFLAALAALLPLPALADPVSMVATLFVTALGEGAAMILASQLVTAAFYVGTMAIGAHQRRRAEQKARNAYNASLKDRTMTVRGTTEPRELVYGRVRKSGMLAFVGTTGAHKSQLYMVIVLAAHEIDAVEQVYFNDEPVTIDSDGRVTSAPWVRNETPTGHMIAIDMSQAGSVTLDKDPIQGSVSALQWEATEGMGWISAGPVTVNGRVVSWNGGGPASAQLSYQYERGTPMAGVWWHLGGESQAADATLQERFPEQWTADHRLRGCAYLVVNFAYDQDVFPNGMPSVSAVIRGARVFDPRTNSLAWSENPALHMRHYATHPLGGNLPAASIDDATIIAAANVCDTMVTQDRRDGSSATASVQRALYRCGLVARSGSRPKEVLDELAETMAGKWCFAGNRLRLKAGAYTPPALSLGDNDFASSAPIKVTPRRSREQLVNVITGTFADEENNWQVVEFARVASDPDIAADGRELPMEVEFSGIPSAAQAQHVARVMIRDARQALTVVAAFKMSAYPVEVFDTIALTCSRYGWVGKPFEVLSREWAPEGGPVRLVLKETDASIYALDAGFDAVDRAPNTLLPSPWEVPRITGLSVFSGGAEQADGSRIARTVVSWDSIEAESVLQSGSIEVQGIELPPPDQPQPDLLSDNWPSWREAGGATRTTIPGLKLGSTYLLRVRGVSTLGTRGPWSRMVVHKVADLDPIGTDELAEHVATEVYTITAPDVSVKVSSYAIRVTAASITYTATTDCVAIVTTTGWVDQYAPLSQWSIYGGIERLPYGNESALWQEVCRNPSTGDPVATGTLAMSKQFALAAGQTVTFVLQGQAPNNEASWRADFRNISMRLEVIKR